MAISAHRPDDCIVAFSTSGRREVVEMLELGRHIGLQTVIGVTSHADSALRRLSDIVIDMGPIVEPCVQRLTCHQPAPPPCWQSATHSRWC